MKAVWNNAVVADAPQEKLIRIEGNWYFPPESMNREHFRENDMHTTCPWKGEASYFDVHADGETSQSGAWYYPQPTPSSLDRVGHDYTDYVAFWRGVEVVE